MVARRDYAAAWRDATATLMQVPVAGILAADYFAQQWVERTAHFLMQVKSGFDLARPAPIGEENLMAGALSEDLMDAARTLTRSLVSLPAEAANHFNRTVEDRVREVLARVQPDATTEPRVYVKKELEKLSREVERLRQVARTAAVARAKGRGRPDIDGDPDVVALGRVLDTVQTAIDRELDAEPPAPPLEAAPEASRTRERDTLVAESELAIRHLRDELNRLEDQRTALLDNRRRAVPDLPETRRGNVNRPRDIREDANG
jgi:hypothetical protein